MNIYIHKYIVLKAIVHWWILLSFTKFSMYQISPNNCYLSSSDFYLGWKPNLGGGGGGGTLNAEVIGMLIRNVFGKPKKIPKLLAQYPKKYKFYWKLFGNFSFLLDMENEQTQKYQNFISAQNFPEDP